MNDFHACTKNNTNACDPLNEGRVFYIIDSQH